MVFMTVERRVFRLRRVGSQATRQSSAVWRFAVCEPSWRTTV